jgi:hypothetical protein
VPESIAEPLLFSFKQSRRSSGRILCTEHCSFVVDYLHVCTWKLAPIGDSRRLICHSDSAARHGSSVNWAIDSDFSMSAFRMLAFRREVLSTLSSVLDVSPKSVGEVLLRLSDGAFSLSLKSSQLQKSPVEAAQAAEKLAASPLQRFATISAQKASIRIDIKPFELIGAVCSCPCRCTERDGRVCRFSFQTHQLTH